MTDPRDNAKISAKPVISRLSGVLDIVHEKLASLKEKEKQIMEMAQARKKKPVDPFVRDELAAMAHAELSFLHEAKASLPARPERPIKRKKDTPVAFLPEKPKTLHSGKTAEEKYRILDARDKVLQARRDRTQGKGQKLVGTCPDMCPEKERLRRCYQSQLSPFEMVDYPQNVDMKEEWMVKEYARSSADQDTPLPHDLRPVPVLQRTMEHLCRNIADRCEYSDELLEDWYMFMWDRTRAIRKDLTHQDACSASAVTLLEQCARFHIHCAERLVDQDLSIYDDKINTENLTKCLQTLKYMYNDLRSVGVVCPNVSEFMCYSLLLNLNNPSIMAEIRDMPDDVMISEPIHFALDVISARETKNYLKFFKLVKRTSYLNCCILRRYFSEVRVHAFSTMVRAYCSKRLSSVAVPLLPIVENLMFENEQDCVNHLNLCNLRFDLREGFVILDRQCFQIPEMAFPLMPSVLYIQQKKNSPLSEIIWGGVLDEPLPQLPLQNSFDASGELKIPTSDLEDEIQVIDVEKDDYVEEDVQIDEDYDNDPGERDYEEEDVFHDSNSGQEFEKPLFSTVVSSKSIFGTSPTISKPMFGNRDNLFSFANFDSKRETSSISFKPSASPATEFSFKPSTPPATKFSLKPSISQATEFAVKTEDPLLSLKPSRSPATEFSFKPSTPPATKISPSISQATEFSFKSFIKPTPEIPAADTQMKIEAERMKKEEDERKKREEEEHKLLKEAREKEQLRRELEEGKKIAEMRRNEEMKKQRELEKALHVEIEQRNTKLKKLRNKYRWWKVGVFARAWRQKAWLLSEEKKVAKYFQNISDKYPPVCGPELLDGNPFELIIPNTLLFQPRSIREFRVPSKSSKSGPPPILPLVHMGRAVGPSLQARVKELYPDPISPYRWCFPWKLVLCLPDELETQVRLDTFLEMHFVDKFNWKFGIETGPLVSCTHTIGTLQLIISIRRIKGLNMWEGSQANPDAVLGANSLLFFLTDEWKKLNVARERLNKIRSLPGGFEIPVVAFVFGERLSPAIIRTALNLNAASRVVMCNGASQQSLVTTLSQSLSLAADISASVPAVRSARLDSLLKTSILDQTWRRVDVALINFDIIMKEPEPLIAYYNQCIANLASSLMDPNLDKQSHLAVEFESVLSQIEKPLKLCSRPKRDLSHCHRIKEYFSRLKLPKWPGGVPKSTQDLNYKLHVYGRSVANRNKREQKYLKWRIYSIIQKTLLWKGLDIYCDEDINLILQRFPWVDVFREFARMRVEITTTDLTVTYDQSLLKNFCHDPPLVDLLGCHEEPESSLDETRPMPEKDSVLLAYSQIIDRLKEEQEASLRYEPSFSEQVAEAFDRSAVLSPSQETSTLKRSFNELEDKIVDISVGLEKRRKILEEMVHELDMPVS